MSLPIRVGVGFRVDAVLPWGDATDQTAKRYRLVLDDDYLPRLDGPDRQRSQTELTGLRTILVENDPSLPFYAYADDADIELIASSDGRVPGDKFVEVWNADDYFPWIVSPQFPEAEDVLNHEIETWLCDDAAAEHEELGFWLSLRPMYVGDPQAEPLLRLEVKPGYLLDYDGPYIDFESERKALYRLDLEEREINVIIQFRILVDLDQGHWCFIEKTNRS